MILLNIFYEKLREVLFSVLPIVIIVALLNLTIVPVEGHLALKFALGSIFVSIGLTFFLIGVDIGITPLGESIGNAIVEKNKLWIVVASSFVVGFVISIAEPGLVILGNQIDETTSGLVTSLDILVAVSLGIGIFMILGFMRLVYNMSFQKIIYLLYGIVLVLAFFTPPEFLAMAFDSSGSTTGILAVPFILSLSLGITSRRADSEESGEDNFGLVAIVSVGAIVSVMILSLLTDVQEFTDISFDQGLRDISVLSTFANAFKDAVKESFLVFSPLTLIFIVVCVTASVPRQDIKRITIGLIYSLVGLILFLTGVSAGFMRLGREIGGYLVGLDSSFYFISIGFVLGVVTILAEPAVHVLTHNIEEITSGYVKKVTVLTALSIGVGIAIALSAMRIIINDVQLWHYLLPGYAIAIVLTRFTSKLFIGIAFDAGGVATGPVTATFILAFINGAANNHSTASILRDGFGMISMVALMPIITLQILGIFYKVKTQKKEVDLDD